MQCARHPKVETGLSCGRCDTPICPRCVIQTDVGARCPACVPRQRPVGLEVGTRYLAQGLGAAAGAGAALGAIWGLLLPPTGVGGFGFFGLILAAFIGYLIAQTVSRAANRRTSTTIQLIAVLGVFIAYLVRNLVGDQVLFVENDVAGYASAIVAGAVAFAYLR